MRAPALTLITDDAKPLEDVVGIVARVCDAARDAGACIAVQLRSKPASGRDLLAAALRMREVTRRAGALLMVNDRVDVALASGADGAHLPAAGMASEQARRLLGSNKRLGRSVHSLAEIEYERVNGAVDYVHFGPIFATPSKAAFGSPQGLSMLARAVRCAAPLGVVAVGGISGGNIADVMRAGASGAAVIGAVMNAPDAGAALRALLAEIGTA